MDQPFHYLSAEDAVPYDAAHVIVGGSVTVVPPCTFEGYLNLERVELREGVEVIGRKAFRNCRNLARVDFPSSLRTIGEEAFYGCRLSELILHEGLEGIGAGAFFSCWVLERISLPSSVAEIGVHAFASCQRLSELILREGPRRIGARVVMVARGAFFDCPRLDRIAIPSVAIVVKAGEDGNGRAAAVTGGIERDPWDPSVVEWDPSFWVDDDEEVEDDESESALLVLTSRYLALMSQEDRTTFTDAIDQITDDQTRGAGPLDLMDEAVVGTIRDCFADCLVQSKTGVAAVLELALWKTNMSQRRESSRTRAAGGGGTARADASSRDDCRHTCGADVVVGPVLSYLWGPHRRAKQEEDRGAIQRQEGSPPHPPTAEGGRWRSAKMHSGRMMRKNASFWRTMLKMIGSISTQSSLDKGRC